MKCGKNNINNPMSGPPNAGFRFNRKSQNENERRVFQNYWKELTQLYGTYIDYFTYDYSLTAHDFFYGEQPLAPFKIPPSGFPILAEFQNDSLLLSKFGIQTEADATFIIPIQSFYEVFGNNVEPKAGDVIRMTELGWDRPGGAANINLVSYAPVTACVDITNPLAMICGDGLMDAGPNTCHTDANAYSEYDSPAVFEALTRGAPCYEITERRDENLTLNYNPLQGHYVWILHAKRFDYSYQPNAPREPGSLVPGDQPVTGLISSLSGNMGWPPASGLPLPEDKRDPAWGDIDAEAKKIWDYNNSTESDDSVYGGYGKGK